MCEISVILPTDSYRTIEPVLRSLSEQTVADRIEVVLVSTEEDVLPSETSYRDAFADLRIVTSDSLAPLPAARSVGIRAARGEWVLIGETHSFLLPDALEILLARGEEGWEVVVPGFLNDNPRSLLSWGSFLASYGRWNQSLPPGPLDEAPAYDSLVRRSSLLALRPGLDEVLHDAEVLRDALEESGARIFLESRARIRHANIELIRAFVHEHSLIGRAIGSRRARHWSLPRRMLYLLATPLVPLVLWRRALTGIRAARSRWQLGLRFELAAIFTFAIKAVGEALGLLGIPWGPKQVAAMTNYEVNRFDYVRDSHGRSEAAPRQHPAS